MILQRYYNSITILLLSLPDRANRKNWEFLENFEVGGREVRGEQMGKIGGFFGENCGIYRIKTFFLLFFAKRFGDLKKKY